MEWLIIILLLVIIWLLVKKKNKNTNTNKDHNIVMRFETNNDYENDDTFEGWFYDEVQDYVNLNKNLKITYKDAKGKETKREIFMYRFGEASFGGFILAHCSLRDENRTFRTDRIIECIDFDTGEYIENVEEYLMNKYYNSEEYKAKIEYEKRQQEKEIQEEYYEEFIDKYKALLKVILYIVKCDGTFNAKEKAILKEIFENLEKNNDLLTDKLLEKVYKNIPMPTINSFKQNVGKLIQNDEFKINFYTLTKNIIETQKSIHPSEQEILDYMKIKYDIQENENIEIAYENEDNVECPHCNSKYIHKKDKRVFKNHTNQRYQCQNCNKIFSIKIEEHKKDEE
ncbi:hypothetical protein CPG37_04470 [Malaciobacter canalis]|uniref:WYL domain-containing protein n=1 Tax=Malaciobacter canalis TaxID=1912871 RepID=A0ABX4LQR4_9BACT|nr:WYL domain-containing protein [Malaciobacter canalis]PHO10306.1 hypothetical protein CPG37_04470 [Malaciobacter canalis]QEE32411.1 hypothetical protein ACAN_0922 [Malaciobacter canalis]